MNKFKQIIQAIIIGSIPIILITAFIFFSFSTKIGSSLLFIALGIYLSYIIGEIILEGKKIKEEINHGNSKFR